MDKSKLSKNIVERAKEFAKIKHNKQKRDSGTNYFEEHICKVGETIRLFTNDEEVIASAYLHDVLEDTKTDIYELVEVFNKRIAYIVEELTHREGDIGYYFNNLHSKEAIMIKFCDRLSNLSNMDCWDKKRQSRYLEKSRFWYNWYDNLHYNKSTKINRNIKFLDKLVNFGSKTKVIGYCGNCGREIFNEEEDSKNIKQGLCVFCYSYNKKILRN